MSAKVQFVLVGFTHEVGVRVFSFDRIGEDQVRTRCSVRADLALTRRYGIQIQELPLLCRAFLDRREELGEVRSLTFTEDEVRACVAHRNEGRALAASKRKPQQQPHPAQ